jgi:AcrR family transcriptional regulator
MRRAASEKHSSPHPHNRAYEVTTAGRPTGTIIRDNRRSTGKRRKQEDRSAETHERLIRAALEVLFEKGYFGLTTALVSERAGVSSGARVHHFRTKADMVVAVAKYAYDEAADEAHKRAALAVHSPNPLRAFIEDCRSVYLGRPFAALHEIVNAARTDDPLMQRIRPILKLFHSRLESTWLDVFTATGCSEEIARVQFNLTLTVMRGLAINNIWNKSPAEHNAMIEDLYQLLFSGREDTKVPRPRTNRKLRMEHSS